MRLSHRFALLIVILLTAVAASCVAGLVGLARQNDALDEVVHVDLRRVLAMTSIRRLFRTMGVTERDLLLEKDRATVASLVSNMDRTRGELDNQLDECASVMPDSERRALDDLRGAQARWVALDDRVLAALDAGQGEDAFVLAQNHAKDPVSWEKVIAGLVAANEQRLRAQVAAASSMHDTTRFVIVVVSGLAALFAVTLGTVLFVGIRRAMADVVRLNSTLESQVAERTRDLASRERSMQLVLDSMDEGLLLVGRNGTLQPECSRAAAVWFGQPSPSARIDAHLYPGPAEAGRREIFAIAFEQLGEDVLPFEVSVAQMPARIRRDDRHFELEYRQVFEDGAFTRVLVIARDITARMAAEKSEREAREQYAILACLLRDRAGFEQFVGETERLLGELPIETSEPELKRKLHTLKGNAGIFGFRSLAERCHDLEEVLAERGGLLGDHETAGLLALWKVRVGALADFLTETGKGAVQVKSGEYELLVAQIRARRDHDALLAQVKSWRWQRTLDRLLILRAHAERLALRLGKKITVQVKDNGVRVPPRLLDGFWAELVHVIRNAVDHGIEAPEARVAAGKITAGTIRLSTLVDSAKRLVVRIADDGVGLDMPALRAAAHALGVESDEPIEILTADGVSTKGIPDEVSGRGVGLGAVRAAATRAGATMSVEHEKGRGTIFTFVVPLPSTPTVTADLAASVDPRLTA